MTPLIIQSNASQIDFQYLDVHNTTLCIFLAQASFILLVSQVKTFSMLSRFNHAINGSSTATILQVEMLRTHHWKCFTTDCLLHKNKCKVIP